MYKKVLMILYPAISIISVAIMMVWGFTTEDWSRCWLAPFIGGCLMAILSIVAGVMGEKKRKGR